MSQFDKMVGGTYLYKGVELIVRDVELLDDGLVRIRTNKKIVNIEKGQIHKEFLPVSDSSRETQLAQYYGFQKDDSQMGKLADVLLENIEKLRNSPAFIEQARVINENARTLIEMQKAKIEMVKLIRER